MQPWGVPFATWKSAIQTLPCTVIRVPSIDRSMMAAWDTIEQEMSQGWLAFSAI